MKGFIDFDTFVSGPPPLQALLLDPHLRLLNGLSDHMLTDLPCPTRHPKPPRKAHELLFLHGFCLKIPAELDLGARKVPQN